MNLTDLSYFLFCARAGSFSGAAKLAHLSPTAISKAIHRLEDDIGEKLFVRTTRSVALTEAGQLLLERGERILREVEQAREAIEELSGTLRGPLRIAANEVFSIELLPRAIARLVAEAPAVEPQLHEMLPHQISEQLSRGLLDIAFTIGGQVSQTVACSSVGRSPGVLVCGRSHPLYRAGRVSKRDLQEHPSVVPRFWSQPGLLSLDQFDDDRYPRKIGATIELLQSAVALAAAGSYLAYVPEISVGGHLASGALRALRGLRSLGAFELQMLTRRGPFTKPSAKRLGQIVSRILAGTERFEKT